MARWCQHSLVLLLLLQVAVGLADPVEIAKDLRRSGYGGVVEASSDEALEGTINADVTPVVQMHGMGDFAANPFGMLPFKKKISQITNGAYVRNVALCDDPTKFDDCPVEDQNNGFLMSMDNQVDQFARVVRSDPQLSQGFNAIGYSQGNTVIRGYVHRYNDPPVKSFISMHGVMMGVAGLPHCAMLNSSFSGICDAVDKLTSFGAYTEFVQNHLAQANYYRDPMHLDSYLKHVHFLPYINNEVVGAENATYGKNFAQLERLALVMALDDTMVHPRESEQFGYFKDGSQKELLLMRETAWYAKDSFGLKSLDTAGKIDFYNTTGDHLRFSEEFWTQMVTKYFAPAVSSTAASAAQMKGYCTKAAPKNGCEACESEADCGGTGSGKFYCWAVKDPQCGSPSYPGWCSANAPKNACNFCGQEGDCGGTGSGQYYCWAVKDTNCKPAAAAVPDFVV